MNNNEEHRPEGEMHRERNLYQYDENLLGLQQFLEYAEELSDNPTLVDIGAGSGKAASELKTKYPQFKVVGVDRVEHPDSSKNLPGNFIVADASDLSEIPAESVNAILLVHSIAYAESKAELKQIVTELKRISKDGAILKGSALHPVATVGTGLKQTSLDISNELEAAGFAVVLASDMGKNPTPSEDVFLAIKLSESDDKKDIEAKLWQIIVDEFVS